MSEKKLRLIMAVVGVCITGITVGIFRWLVLGTDPCTSWIIGISNIFDAPYSVTYPIVFAVIFLIVFLLHRHYLGIATVINLFGIGIISDLTLAAMEALVTDPSMAFRIVLLVVNVIILSWASSLYFTADLGVSAYDAIALMAANEYKIAQFRVCRVTTDLFCVIFGFIFGADIGIGTVITAFMMGPIVQWFNENFSEPLLNSKRKVRHLR